MAINKIARRSRGAPVGDKATRRRRRPGTIAWAAAAATLALPAGAGVATPVAPAAAAGTTELVSVATSGARANSGAFSVPAISKGGRFVAFESFARNLVPGDTNKRRDVFVRDRWTGRTERVSIGAGGVQANNSSGTPTISAGGRFVAFASNATNLVPGGPSGVSQVYVRAR